MDNWIELRRYGFVSSAHCQVHPAGYAISVRRPFHRVSCGGVDMAGGRAAELVWGCPIDRIGEHMTLSFRRMAILQGAVAGITAWLTYLAVEQFFLSIVSAIL